MFVPSPRLRGEGDMALLRGKLGEGDHPHAPDLLKVPPHPAGDCRTVFLALSPQAGRGRDNDRRF